MINYRNTPPALHVAFSGKIPRQCESSNKRCNSQNQVRLYFMVEYYVIPPETGSAAEQDSNAGITRHLQNEPCRCIATVEYLSSNRESLVAEPAHLAVPDVALSLFNGGDFRLFTEGLLTQAFFHICGFRNLQAR